MMNEPTSKIPPSPKVAALPAAAAATAGAAAARPQRSDVHWDAAASTCVSGSEGSLPHSVRHQQQEERVQQQQSRQRQAEGPPMEASNSESSDMHSLSPSNPIDQRPHPYLQHEQQQRQQPSPMMAAGGAARFQTARSQAGSDSSDCGEKTLPTEAAATAAAFVPVAQIHRGRSSSSSCSSMSIGAELKGLIAALGVTDTAGSNELQQQLQQLLAERDLYKAAFGAAKEELKASSDNNTNSSNTSHSNTSSSNSGSNSRAMAAAAAPAIRIVAAAAAGAIAATARAAIAAGEPGLASLCNLECRQQQLTQALQTFEQERVQERMQQQQQLEVEEEASSSVPEDSPLHRKASRSSSSMLLHPVDANALSLANNCNAAEGPYTWLQQLHACVASGTYPRADLLQKSVEQQQQLIRLAEGLQQERESYVEAVACLHSQLREAREDVSLYMSAHATHAADLTAESDEALRAADLWLQHSLRVGTQGKFWGLGSVIHSQEAAAANAARRGSTPAVRATSSSSSSMQSEAAAAAAAAALASAEEPPPGVAVAVAAAACVFGLQDESSGDDACSSGTATAAPGVSSTAELERLWWGRSSAALLERQQLQMQHRQREKNNRLLWFLE
ncbi:hypothetical protein Esti_004118 [Eimeria stiedai]